MSEELPKSDPRVVSQAKKSTGYKRDKRKKSQAKNLWQFDSAELASWYKTAGRKSRGTVSLILNVLFLLTTLLFIRLTGGAYE